MTVTFWMPPVADGALNIADTEGAEIVERRRRGRYETWKIEATRERAQFLHDVAEFATVSGYCNSPSERQACRLVAARIARALR